jgi:hypothetical protein
MEFRPGVVWKISRTTKVALRARRRSGVGEILLVDSTESRRDFARTSVIKLHGEPPAPECLFEVCRAWRNRMTPFHERAQRTPHFVVNGHTIQLVLSGRPAKRTYPSEPLTLDATATPEQWNHAALALLDAALSDLEL